MIKIFGGVAKGFPLKTPASMSTRPTSVLLRRKLYDSLQDLTGFIFIDLCAGTGSMGLEAASRGARKVVFVENSKEAYRILKTNRASFLSKFAITSSLDCIQIDFRKWLKVAATKIPELALREKQTLLFFDPPYEKVSLYEDFFDLIETNSLKGLFVIEACEQKTMKIGEFQTKFGEAKKFFKQGSRYFVIYDIQ